MSEQNTDQPKGGEKERKDGGFLRGFDSKVLMDSIRKLDPLYLARNNAVMFTVEVGFVVVLIIGLFPSLSSSQYITQAPSFYLEVAIILILTVWFATFSESLSEAQAKSSVESLRRLEREVTARKIVGGKEIVVSSSALNQGDEVNVRSGEIIPRDGIVTHGKAYVDESMMTGESNPVFKEKGEHVIGGTQVASDNLLIEITAEKGRSFLDQMIGLIKGAKRPKTQNEIALTILLAGMSLIFIMVIGSLLFLSTFLGYPSDIAMLIALLVALMPTTIGGLLPAIGVAGITRLGRDNIVAKSGKGIESAGDCDVLVLDKTGTITEGSRGAIEFVPLVGFTEEDVGEAAFVASFHDSTHEGKSIIELAEEKQFIPPLVESLLTARPIEFSAETRYSGIEFVRKKRNIGADELPQAKDSLASKTTSLVLSQAGSRQRVRDMLIQLDESSAETKVLKGSLDTMLKIAPNVNESELKWKAQEISRTGGTPLVVAINDVVIGLVSLKDNLKQHIKEKLDEVRATGIMTVMITGDAQLTARVIAKDAGVDQVMAEAKPTDKLRRVEEEQVRGHVIGMVGDGTNDAPALAKADIGLAMNSGTAAAKEAANMVDLDSDPSKILHVVKLGKQLLMTRGAITTFSVANDAAKYFAILPAIFATAASSRIQELNIMGLHNPQTAILSTLIFNAIIIPMLIPLALHGVTFKPETPQKTFLKNMLIYGLGGAALPFVGIKAIDIILSAVIH
ncbi:MAG: HAD-IC family P-type ATPase [Thaumarchaeota archaeon]|nr:HAD-IC family P-type ATPase [Nitrososphaerota archaeon]